MLTRRIFSNVCSWLQDHLHVEAKPDRSASWANEHRSDQADRGHRIRQRAEQGTGHKGEGLGRGQHQSRGGMLINISINIRLTNPNSLNTKMKSYLCAIYEMCHIRKYIPITFILNDNNILSPFNDVTSNWINFIVSLIVSMSLSLRTISASSLNLFIISSITSWRQQCHLGLYIFILRGLKE